MQETISVIVPVYNVEGYIRQCLDSLVHQTYCNIEIILVDDGSKDSSGIICDEYSQKYDCVKVVHKVNAGLGMARNTGMEYMTGKYVTFVDSDDWVQSDFLEILYSELTNQNVDFCKCGYQRVGNDGTVIFTRKYKNELYPGKKAMKELLPRMIGSSPSQHDSIEMCVWGVLYNADIIRLHNLSFPSERIMISEDLTFNIDYMQFANGACTIDAVGYLYRINDNSLSRSYRPDRYKSCSYFYSEIKKKLIYLGYDDTTLLRLKRMFFIYVRMSISQESTIVSGLPSKENKKHIYEICSDPLLRDVIKKYPVYKLGFRQAAFIFLVYFKSASILHFLAEKGLIR